MMRRAILATTLLAVGLLTALVVAGSSSGQGGGGPVFQPSTWDMTFDFVQVGHESAIQTLTVTNEGPAPETFSSVTIRGRDPQDFAIEDENCQGATLNDQDQCHVDVIFKPTQTGTRIARLRFLDNTACGDVVNLAGSGTSSARSVTASAAACGNNTTTVTKTVGGGGGGGTTTTTTTTTGPTQTVTVSSAPSSNPTVLPCTSRRNFKIAITAPKNRTYKTFKATVAKRPLAVKKGKKRAVVQVDLRGFPRGRFALHALANLSPKGKLNVTKHFVTCTPGTSG
jgi:hypothetical protein